MAKPDIEFTFDQAVKTMGLTPNELEKLIDEGKVKASREGGRTLISRVALLEYMATVSKANGNNKK